MMLFYNNNNKEGQIRDEEFVAARQEARRPDAERCRRRRAAGREPVEVHADGVRPGRVLRRQGHPRSAERRPAARPQGADRRRPSECAAQRQHDRPRHEGQQGGDARHARRRSSLYSEGSRRGGARVREARRDDPKRRRPSRGVTAEIFVPEVANHVPHVRVSWDARGNAPSKPATSSRRLRDGEPSIVDRVRRTRRLVIGVWMMQPGEDRIVATRLRQVLEGTRSTGAGRERTAMDRRTFVFNARSGTLQSRPRRAALAAGQPRASR